ncbi:hypothetical protein QKW35_04970 [Pontibacterium granulatum]|uniref:hypothetical protein n=1 Tax=Pontibacterium granulatum TaxID=2036029 RepID=UPI00249B1375|nr:hypothetical protein [Pontibacterium granulatum]MDI3323725.1 hypothetical protein [Pontibacterium granulatum]
MACTQNEHVAHYCSITGRDGLGKDWIQGLYDALDASLRFTSTGLRTTARGQRDCPRVQFLYPRPCLHVTSTQRDMLGVELESKHVIYRDQPVTFQYQLWRLRKNSVCAQLKHNLLEYSKCTRAARALFIETCRHLTNNPSDHWKHQKLKNLYCAASVEFKSVVAEVRRSTVADDQELKRRQQCSVLRIQAMSSRDPRTIQLRDEVCGR